MRSIIGLLAAGLLAACGAVPHAADPGSDAPELRVAVATAPENMPASYGQALARWHSAQDINAWIGARFQYDMSRAMLLSETQRALNARLPIPTAQAFFESPRGVCVDLSRFAVDTLRAVDPGANPKYLMIEFDPVSIAGNTLRRHWVVWFERDGTYYAFADSKRPGHIAGPYASAQQFIDEYASYRGRRIVSFREMQSYARKARAVAAKPAREGSL